MITYKVDDILVKHFKTALKLAVKSNAKLVIRIEVKKDFKKSTVIFRDGTLYVSHLSKGRKQWAESFIKNVVDIKPLWKLVKRSKYQRRKQTVKFVQRFNELTYERQQIRIKAIWSRRKSIKRDLSLDYIVKDLTDKGCVIKRKGG